MESRSNRATSHTQYTVKPPAGHYIWGSTSHNVHCVKNTTAHYIWGEEPQEESLTEKVCCAAAFLGCVVILMFLG